MLKVEGIMKQFSFIFLVTSLMLILCFGCIKLKHDMTIQPVHVTVEIRLKIDKDLEDFFGDIDGTSKESKIKKEEGDQ